MTCTGTETDPAPPDTAPPEPGQLGASKIRDRVVEQAAQLPITWAGEACLRHWLLSLFPDSPRHVDLGVYLWLEFNAYRNVDRWQMRWPEIEGPTAEEYITFFRKRLYGFDSYGVSRVYYDERRLRLMRLENDGSSKAIWVRAETLSPKSHQHEWQSTLGCSIRPMKKKGGGPRWYGAVAGIDTKGYLSVWNKAISGSRPALAMLGVPAVERLEFPAANVEDDARLAEDHVVELRRTVRFRSDAAHDLDVVAYFEDWRVREALPFGSPDDVRRFVCALASPLVRYAAPGLLGCYWIVGPPGAGKDFTAELAPDIWLHAMGRPTTKVKFDLDAHDELELKRCLAAAGSALYGRAKEAAKRGQAFTTTLIRLGGTDQVAARAMRQDEIEIPNQYTLLADSAEEIPEGREISRRTMVIRLHRLDDDSLGAARAAVLARAADVMVSLKHLIEAQPIAYWTQQERTQGRPSALVGLARLFGVALDEVKGASLDDLWEGLRDYIEGGAGQNEAKLNASRVGGDWRLPLSIREAISSRAVNVHRMSAAVAELAGYESPHRIFFANWKSYNGLVNKVRKETDYDRDARRDGYMRILIDGQPYAFRFLREGRYFVLAKEMCLCTALGIPTSSQYLAAGAAPPTPPCESSAPEVNGSRSIL